MTADKNFTDSRYPITVTALMFGVGMALGFFMGYFLLKSPLIRAIAGLVGDDQPFIALLFGIFLFLGTIGLAGGLAGLMGGHALARFSDAATEKRFKRRGALSFFLAHAIIALPTLAVLAVAAFFNQDIDVSFSKLPLVLGLLGLAYGLLAGLLFGLQTAGFVRTLPVLVSAAVGFGAGGLLLGLLLRLAADWDADFLRLLMVTIGFFFFGAAGGGMLGFTYKNFQDERRIFPASRVGNFARAAFAAALLILALTAVSNLLTLARINIPDLAEQLVLPTVGTGWTGAQGALQGAVPAVNSEEISCQNGRITVVENGAVVTREEWAPCFADPLVATAADGRPHAVWYSDRVARVLGGETPGHFILESIADGGLWSAPSIIDRPGGALQPQLSSDAAGTLYVTWEEGGANQALSMTPYSCEGPPAGAISQAVYAAVRSEQFRPADDPVTYCDNRFDRLHFTPNPKAPELPFENTPLGAFDTVADLVRDAQYEVSFVTMQWDAPSEYDSPGDALSRAVAELYQKVKANPDDYPRGMTVRILLGNLPEPAVFSFANQLHHVIIDMQEAGVEPSDPEIGWKIELANYSGNLPHAHSKFLVVDGETAVAAGFNYSYLHLEEDHPHELALGMTDMGLQMTGPVAQTVLAAYDDLWRNSESVNCWGNPPSADLLFSIFCRSEPTEVSHAPEVLRFRPAEDNEYAAFALHHTLAHLESDAALLAAIGAAQESIDLFEVNFSLDSPCLVLAQVSDECQEEEFAPVYMLALRDAVINNDVRLRVMMEESAMNGIENRTGIIWLYEQLSAAGKEGNLDLRFSAHKMHNKAMLVDEEFLSVGSQNFHYSAWGSPSLTEYNLATDDPEAVSEFLTEFEYWWDQAIPVEDIIKRELDELDL
jgi:phosphatidylserine/phosphatidylglycerophosphate/cardiolipin synthase-like enzyme/MFS family permease